MNINFNEEEIEALRNLVSGTISSLVLEAKGLEEERWKLDKEIERYSNNEDIGEATALESERSNLGEALSEVRERKELFEKLLKKIE